MSLSGLLPLLYDQPSYGALARAVASSERAWTEASLDPARPYLLAALHADITGPRERPMIIVSPRSERARRLYEGLIAYSPPGTPIYFFPAPDLLPYERIAPDPPIVGERLTVLANLGVRGEGRGARGEGLGVRDESLGTDTQHSAPPIIVTSVFALMQPTMAPADMEHAMRLLRKGERVNLREFVGHLVDLGYESAPLVEEPGQFSRRGGIVDLYPPTANLPVR
ncbi:MAG TPA: hypothetical protein VEW94_09960, partial [Chloroflexia bacterium]|nr:hypothetical protein [Chloroflexia bacterium]